MDLGRNTSNGNKVHIAEKDRSTHMQVVGSTGTGKSKFLEGMIRQDILAGRGLCVVDITGALYNNLAKWIASYNLEERRKIILFDPTEEGWIPGFNPLLSNFDTSFLVDNMVKAIAKVWGGEDQDRTPLLKRCLRLILYVLAEKKLSLLEAQRLISPDDPTVRHYLTHNLEDPTMREEWDFLNQRTKSQFVEDFASTRNRLMEFVSSPTVRNIVGQTEGIINFRQVMEEGHIVLVNLQPKGKLSWDNARLLGTLIVNDLFINAMAREEGAKPFYLYIDECSLFLNEDIGFILDLCRKYGLHLILAHQHLGQLRDAGEKIYRSVMTDAKTKVIFGGLDYDDAEAMVKNVFMGDIELAEWKSKLTKPTVAGFTRTWFENYSNSKGYSWGTGSSEGIGSGVAMVQGTGAGVTTKGGGVFPGEEMMNTATQGISQAQSSFDSKGTSSFEGGSDSESHGKSEGLEPIFQDLPVESYSLEEQIWRRMALMVNQDIQHAIIKLPGKKSKFVKTKTIKGGHANDGRIKRFKEQNYLSTYFIKTIPEAVKEIDDRRQALFNQARRAAIETANPTLETTPADPDGAETEKKETFREKRVKHKKI